MCSVRYDFIHHDCPTLNFRFLLMHINLLNSDQFYSSNKVYHNFQEIFVFISLFYNCCLISHKVTTGMLISQKFTTGCFFFFVFRDGGKVSLNILHRVFLILRYTAFSLFKPPYSLL